MCFVCFKENIPLMHLYSALYSIFMAALREDWLRQMTYSCTSVLTIVGVIFTASTFGISYTYHYSVACLPKHKHMSIYELKIHKLVCENISFLAIDGHQMNVHISWGDTLIYNVIRPAMWLRVQFIRQDKALRFHVFMLQRIASFWCTYRDSHFTFQ